jgi:hypothetical protein
MPEAAPYQRLLLHFYLDCSVMEWILIADSAFITFITLWLQVKKPVLFF